MRSEIDMALRLKSLHDLERGVGIVGRVEQLFRSELGSRPVAGGDGFGFFETLVKQNSHSAADADLSPVAHSAEDLIEVEDVIERNSQSIPDLSVIVFQSEAHLEKALGSDEIPRRFFALASMKLEKVSFVGEGKLHDVRAVAFLSCAEGRPRFGVESAQACRENFIDRFPAFRPRRGHMDPLRGKPGKFGEKGRLSLRRCDRSTQFSVLPPIA